MAKTRKIITVEEAKRELRFIDLPQSLSCDCGHWDGCCECHPAMFDPDTVKEIKRLKRIVKKAEDK